MPGRKKTSEASGSGRKKKAPARKKAKAKAVKKPKAAKSAAGSARRSKRPPGADAPAVVVRKYENRRLYDTSASCYINLDRVAEMVRDGIDVQVVEVKTDRDVTRQVLTQIIVESSRGKEGPPLEFLRDLIRANDRARRDFFQWYLASAAEVYHSVRDSFEAAAKRSPGPGLGALSKLWPANPIGQALARALGGQEAAAGTDADADIDSEESEEVGSAADQAELEELRQRLERIERRFGKG